MKKEGKFKVSEKYGYVSYILDNPLDAKALVVIAHGAGVPMRHEFMDDYARILSKLKIASFRFNFPYSEKNAKTPNPAPVLEDTISKAYQYISEMISVKGVPLFGAGKSMGGRLTSMVEAKTPIKDLKGLIFLGFPLHAPNRPSKDRADYLPNVKIPMLFIQGEKDALADLNLMKDICKDLGKKAKLKIIEDGDHSFKIPKQTERTYKKEVLNEIANSVNDFIDKQIFASSPESVGKIGFG
ncbi:MAG: dienelactone hydrolase family protein [Deltaproteobacteria bacterium]|nr:dienelactone hydrolase family protein [Deltaproteobacteria bacterium]